jgi:hypothetical protein
MVVRIRKIAVIALVNVAIVADAFVLLEGLASTALFVRHVANAPPVAERRHTQYDSLLGWVNVPNVATADMYGPGGSLRINGQGLRNDRDFPSDVPLGKARVIYAGDSFTFGYGMSNAQT